MSELITAPASSPAQEPKLVAADPRPEQVVNIIRYHAVDQGHNLDQYSSNIPDAAVAEEVFKLAVERKQFAGKPIRSCAVIVGGYLQGGSLHGGIQVAAWSEEGGPYLPEGWESNLGGQPRPAVVQTKRGQLGGQTVGQADGDPGDEQKS